MHTRAWGARVRGSRACARCRARGRTTARAQSCTGDVGAGVWGGRTRTLPPPQPQPHPGAKSPAHSSLSKRSCSGPDPDALTPSAISSGARGAPLAGGDPREKPGAHQGPRTPLPSLLGNSPALTLPGYQGLTQPWLQFIRNNNHETTGAGRKFPIFPHFLPPQHTTTIAPSQHLAPGQVPTLKSGTQQGPTLQTPSKTKRNGSGTEEGRGGLAASRLNTQASHRRCRASSPAEQSQLPPAPRGASAASLQPPRWEGRTESWEPGPGRDFSSTKIIPGQKKQITVIVAGAHGTAGVRVKDACR